MSDVNLKYMRRWHVYFLSPMREGYKIRRMRVERDVDFAAEEFKSIVFIQPVNFI
jgi:hypothetical protein